MPLLVLPLSEFQIGPVIMTWNWKVLSLFLSFSEMALISNFLSYLFHIKGWQLAVLVLVALVGIVLSVSLVVMINKYKKGYETYV